MAEDDKQQPRRVKVTDAAAHRTGARRAAIKPHTRSKDAAAKQVVSDYLAGLKAGALSQTYWGETLTKNAVALRTNFGLAANDELFLLSDPTATGQAGLMLSTSGVHLADGRGGKLGFTWDDFAKITVGYQRGGALLIGQNSIATKDAQALATLLKQIQEKLA